MPYSWSVFDRTDVFYDEDQLANSAVQPVQVWVLDGSADADPRHVEDSERDEPVGTAQVFAIRSQELAEIVSLPTEREFFGGDNSMGVGGDLRAATALATHMMRRAAMGDTLSSPLEWQGYGTETANSLDARVEDKLRERYEFAAQLIRDNRWFVLAIAHALVTRNTILGDDVDAIYRGTQGVIVDGTWYHDPANRDALEAYHAKALTAHESQTVGFDGDIPKPPLPPPAAIEATATGDPGGSTDLPPPSPAPPEPTE